jgi:hypothetical protein
MERVHENVVLCLEYKHVVKGPEIPRGIASENDPCPKGYTRKTADAAATGAEYATQIQGLIPSR